MARASSSRPRRVVIVGGGVAALEAAFALRALAGELVELELLTAEPRFFYRPQAVLEPFSARRVEEFELSPLAEAVGAQLTSGELASVSAAEHVARTRRGMAIDYDALLIAVGAAPHAVLPAALTFRGPADTERVAAIAHGDVREIVLAIPERRTWPLPIYELAFGLRTVTDVPIRIATAEPAAGAVLGANGSAELAASLAAHEIDLAVRVGFADDSPTTVHVAAPALLANLILGIPADDDGFIPVSRLGAVDGLRDVYAAGDVTTYEVKHGSIAAAQADAAAETVAAWAGAELQPAPFRAVLRAHVACGDASFYVRHDLDDPFDAGTVSRDPLWSPAGKIFARHLGPALVGMHGGTPLSSRA